MESTNSKLGGKENVSVRDLKCAVHIPDIVLGDYFYQLTDYYPSGNGSGRRFSTRYGAIGKTWRIERNDCWNPQQTEATTEELIDKWGMTKHEAEVAKSKGLAITILLLDDMEIRSGVLFIGSREKISESVYDALKQVVDEIPMSDTSTTLRRLGSALGKIRDQLLPSGTILRFHSDD